MQEVYGSVKVPPLSLSSLDKSSQHSIGIHLLCYRLKKEMVLRLNQVAAEFRKVSNKQMADTTKRTIRENVSINTQLAKMSDKTMELIQENDELRAKEKKMKLQVDMLEHNEKELAKKNSSNQKVSESNCFVDLQFSSKPSSHPTPRFCISTEASQACTISGTYLQVQQFQGIHAKWETKSEYGKFGVNRKVNRSGMQSWP